MNVWILGEKDGYRGRYLSMLIMDIKWKFVAPATYKSVVPLSDYVVKAIIGCVGQLWEGFSSGEK